MSILPLFRTLRSLWPRTFAAVVTFVLSFCLLQNWAKQRIETRFQDAIGTLELQRGYQGLVLDTPGSAGFLITLLEQDQKVFVRDFKMLRSGGQSLVRHFEPSQGSSFSDIWLSRYELSVQNTHATILISRGALWIHFALSTLLAALIVFLSKLFQNWERKQRELVFSKKMEEIAMQVAHDIRSPLASLISVAHNTPGLDEDTRIQLRVAVNRIRDIANQLLSQYRIKIKESDKATITTEIKEPLPDSSELLSALVDTVIFQKRAQFRGKKGIQIEANFTLDSYGLFTRVKPTELSRILSNLINNSVEAIGETHPGEIKISLTQEEGWAVLRIQDSGRGIPADLLAQLGTRGVTYGKEGSESGFGLGIFHAKTTLESWGGQFGIDSVPRNGTTVTLKMQKQKPPEWFVEVIHLKTPANVIILDDDMSIHQIWRQRIEAVLRSQQNEISLIHHHSAAETLQWYRQSFGQVENPLYLCDYELIGSQQTGLDVIELLGIARESILVTSHYEEKSIRQRCEKFGIRLIPKNLAPFVPIQITPSHILGGICRDQTSC